MKLFGLPDDLRDALQLLMCERTYLIQLVKGLIEKLLPSLLEENKKHQLLLAQPKFFNDPFLEKQYSKPAMHVQQTVTTH
jgi:hypothetical protein